MLNILKILSKNHPNQSEILQEAFIVLQKQTPQQCLLKFLRRMDSYNVYSKKEISTPMMSSTKAYDFSTPEILENLKEKIHAVASTSICRSQLNSSISNQLNTSIPLTPISSPSLYSLNNNSHFKFNLDLKEYDNEINIISVPILSQEMILLNEILYSLLGIRGNYIQQIEQKLPSGNTEINFKVSDQIQKSLRDVANEILPLGCYYYYINNFTENVRFFNCGQVLESFTASLKDLLHDYKVSL